MFCRRCARSASLSIRPSNFYKLGNCAVTVRASNDWPALVSAIAQSVPPIIDYILATAGLQSLPIRRETRCGSADYLERDYDCI
jgi:hypothetical protein